MKKYLRELFEQAHDSNFLVIELALLWLCVCFTVLCVGTVAWYLFN